MRLSTLSLALPLLSPLTQLVHCWGETPEEVAQRSRSLLTDSTTFGVGILSTIYPDDYAIKELRGFVTSGSDYFAPCYSNGDLLVLALPVSQNWKNALTSPGKNATMTIVSNVDPDVPDPRHETPDGKWDPDRPDWRKGMYSKQRLTLFGHLETVRNLQVEEDASLQSCYLRYHLHATHFIPGSKDSPHLAIWTRFIVDRIYRVGGYGDESQIGWVDLESWQQAGKKMKEINPRGRWHQKMMDSPATTTLTSGDESNSESHDIQSLFGDRPLHNVAADLIFQD